jgi:hypothetical protein
LDGFRFPDYDILARYHGAVCRDLSVKRLAGEAYLPEQPEATDGGNERASHPPPCRVTSGVCSLPLGAKVGLTVVLSAVAWPLQDWAFNQWVGFSGRRLRWRAAGGFVGSLRLLFAAIAIWFWAGR